MKPICPDCLDRHDKHQAHVWPKVVANRVANAVANKTSTKADAETGAQTQRVGKYKDPEKRRLYMRDLMRKKRAKAAP